MAINRNNYSFPIGKIETMTLYPLDFEEFLWAMQQKKLCVEIHICYNNMQPIVDGLHKKAIEFYRKYLIIGGMPVSINAFMKILNLLTYQIYKMKF